MITLSTPFTPSLPFYWICELTNNKISYLHIHVSSISIVLYWVLNNPTGLEPSARGKKSLPLPNLKRIFLLPVRVVFGMRALFVVQLVFVSLGLHAVFYHSLQPTNKNVFREVALTDSLDI